MDDVAPRTRVDWVLLAGISAIPLVLLVASTRVASYGYFIDEFYYVACARHLALGYVDHPPLAPWILAATMPVLGQSLLGLRLVPFLAAAGTVWVTGLLVRELRGGRYATGLAGLAVGLAPVILAMSGFFSMNAFEPLLWSLIVLALVRLVRSGNSRLWLVVGLLVGVAFENKHTVLMYLVALGAGVVVTPTRRVLTDRWFWAGAAVALVLALPNVAWQMANGWPSLEFYHNAQVLKNEPSPPVASLMAQAMVMNVVALPVWLAGLWYLLFARQGRPLRFLGLMFVVLLAIHVVSQTSRPDRTAAAYPLLLAAGAVVIERWLLTLEPRSRALVRCVRVGFPVVVVATGLALTPVVLPLLPPATLAPYAALLGQTRSAERGKTSPIPQLLADRTGWESFVDEVERVYRSLPPDDQARALIYAPSYGHAGALELWGPARGLPAVISAHNTYWHWSVGRANTDVLIAVDASPEVLRELFAEVWEAGRVRCDYCMSWRSDMPVFVARGPVASLEDVWPRYRHYE